MVTALAVVFVGCIGSGEVPVYPVRGLVQLAHKPLAEAEIVLHPTMGDGRSLVARTDPNGKFEITTHQPGDGAPAGVYVITIQLRELVQEGDEVMRVGPQPVASEIC